MSAPRCAADDWKSWSGSCRNIVLQTVGLAKTWPYSLIGDAVTKAVDSIGGEMKGGGPNGPGSNDKKKRVWGIPSCGGSDVQTFDGLFAVGDGTRATYDAKTNECYDMYTYYNSHPGFSCKDL